MMLRCLIASLAIPLWAGSCSFLVVMPTRPTQSEVHASSPIRTLTALRTPSRDTQCVTGPSGGSAVSGHPSSTTMSGCMYPLGGGLAAALCLSRLSCRAALPPQCCLVCCREHPVWDCLLLCLVIHPTKACQGQPPPNQACPAS
eukprot:9035721-Pyramimonas_sp.AAC.1